MPPAAAKASTAVGGREASRDRSLGLDVKVDGIADPGQQSSAR